MTTVAANREMIAADGMWVSADLKLPGTKLFRVGNAVVGVCGHNLSIQMFLQWFRDGAEGPRPEFPTEDDYDFSALVLAADGLRMYDASCVAWPVESWAIGSGAAAALGAMRAGKNPAEAVEIACDIDNQSGRPVEVYTLATLSPAQPPKPKRRGRRT